MKNILKNLFILVMALFLLPFIVAIAVLSIPVIFHSFVMDHVNLNMPYAKIWNLNKGLEFIINALLYPLSR